jgi:hypothetical protein
MKQIFIAIAIGVLIGSAVEASQGSGLYVTLGGGVGGAGSAAGLAYGCNVSRMIGKTVISVRAIGCRELNIFGPEMSTSDYSVLAGIRTRSAKEQASIEGGIGFVRIGDRGRLLVADGWFGPAYEQARRSAAGFSWQGQYYYRGFGLVFYGDFNKIRSFAGLLLGFRFGKW